MATLSLKHVRKIYPNGFEAVEDFNLEVSDKEFIVFVGPSGCGKTTTLRMIAGLEEITEGEIYIDDVLINELLPKDRNIAMVFQSYALYPHMSIFDNMAFGLSLHHIPEAEITARVNETAKILGLTDQLEKFPRELSGGQRQRVALGRAIVRKAKVFLMDEPLSNLDAKLRGDMRREIIKIHHAVGAITVYVTHDQMEAMTMATRLVVMSNGVVQQIGTPTEVYTSPNNKYVAGFIGAPMMNFVNCIYKDGNLLIGKKSIIPVPEKFQKALKKYNEKEIIFGIRPEHFHRNKNNEKVDKIEITITYLEMLGHEMIIRGVAEDQTYILRTATNSEVSVGKVLCLDIDEEHMHFFDKDTEQAIR